jgi:UDP-N-acetylglucosamine acyltransferase
VQISEWAIIGGLSAIHQFVRIGRHAMVGGMSGIENDIIPYGSVIGNRARLQGLNIVGLKRRDFSRDVIHSLRNAYRLLFAQEGTMTERIEDVSNMMSDVEPVMEIVDFMRADSSRGICQSLEDAA